MASEIHLSKTTYAVKLRCILIIMEEEEQTQVMINQVAQTDEYCCPFKKYGRTKKGKVALLLLWVVVPILLLLLAMLVEIQT
jgi:hypothetical protein